jgi:hypothetical protein
LLAGQRGKAEAVKNAKVHATVDIGSPTDRPGFGLAVKISVENVEDMSLVEAAHEVGLITR